jgi:Rrf2 family transcriptional regulator, nitric oxide-sensitive transcriptional repressor
MHIEVILWRQRVRQRRRKIAMRLTLGTDYALRTLIYVGAKGGGLSTIAEIAESFGVSKTHLMKVVNRLGQQGYLDTIRGKGGGIRLARPPAQIRVGVVVRDTEEDLAVMGCLAQTGFCRIEGCCVLRRALRQATHAFLQTLDGFTLADLLAPGARLGDSLGIAPAMQAFE